MLATHPQTPVDHMALLMLQSHRCSPHCQIASGWTTDAQGLLSAWLCYCYRPRQRHKWLSHCHRLQGSNPASVELDSGEAAVHEEVTQPATWLQWSGGTLQGLAGCSLAEIQPWTTCVQLFWVRIPLVLWWDGIVFMRWQNIHEMAKYSWNGKVFIRWQSIYGMAKYSWDGKVFMRWQNIHEVAKYTWDGKVYMRLQRIHEMA